MQVPNAVCSVRLLSAVCAPVYLFLNWSYTSTSPGPLSNSVSEDACRRERAGVWEGRRGEGQWRRGKVKRGREVVSFMCREYVLPNVTHEHFNTFQTPAQRLTQGNMCTKWYPLYPCTCKCKGRLQEITYLIGGLRWYAIHTLATAQRAHVCYYLTKRWALQQWRRTYLSLLLQLSRCLLVAILNKVGVHVGQHCGRNNLVHASS